MILYPHQLGDWYYLWGKGTKTCEDHRPPELLDKLSEADYEIMVSKEMITEWRHEVFDNPIRALFIGIRTVSNGYTKVATPGAHYWGEDHELLWSPSQYIQTSTFPLYLFVTHYRRNPIHAFPCDVSESETIPDQYLDRPKPTPICKTLDWWIIDIVEGQRQPLLDTDEEIPF